MFDVPCVNFKMSSDKRPFRRHLLDCKTALAAIQTMAHLKWTIERFEQNSKIYLSTFQLRNVKLTPKVNIRRFDTERSKSMTTIKYIGRTTDFRGKTLWEIVGNLKNHGVGRIVIRHTFQRYAEPSYMKIMKVEAMPNPTEGDRKARVFVEKTFRGRTLPKLVEICSTSYKTDYQLIPKNKEAEICRPWDAPEMKILPQHIEFPPLLRQFIINETGNPDPQLKVKLKTCREKLVRVAKDGETPTMEISMGLGKPASPNLYKNVSL